MIEIRFHGRGGQGVVTAAEILALAAFLEGKEAQAFPEFGAERRGAPVKAFCRIDSKKINIRSGVYEPNIVVCLDASLIKTIDVFAGLKRDGRFVLNAKKIPDGFPKKGILLALVDATAIAVSHKLGSEANPIINVAILGAVAPFAGVSTDSLAKAIGKKIIQRTEDNIRACKESVQKVKLY